MHNKTGELGRAEPRAQTKGGRELLRTDNFQDNNFADNFGVCSLGRTDGNEKEGGRTERNYGTEQAAD